MAWRSDAAFRSKDGRAYPGSAVSAAFDTGFNSLLTLTCVNSGTLAGTFFASTLGISSREASVFGVSGGSSVGQPHGDPVRRGSPNKSGQNGPAPSCPGRVGHPGTPEGSATGSGPAAGAPPEAGSSTRSEERRVGR